MGVRPDIEMLTAVVIAGLLIITVIPPTSIILIAVAVPRTYYINTHIRRYPSTRVYVKKSFSGFYGSKTNLHHRLYIQIYYMKYAMRDSFF